jgi:hypothetical protein
LANIVGDVDSLHVEIDNLNDLLVGFYFIRSIDKLKEEDEVAITESDYLLHHHNFNTLTSRSLNCKIQKFMC